MSDDETFALARRPDQIYFSKEFRTAATSGGDNESRPQRFVSRVLKAGPRDEFVMVKGEVVIRVTDSGRQQIKGLLYVDERKLHTLTLQRFTSKSGQPHRTSYFSLRGDEIDKLLELASIVKTANLENPERTRIDEADLDQFTVTREAARVLARTNWDVLIELVEQELTARDITALAYRRSALDYFARLLADADFFAAEQKRFNLTGREALWQHFFELNSWIFGYGLYYVFTSAFDGQRLEQIVAGHSIASRGKRTDALLKTQGRISSLCFVELKTHDARLLANSQYRPDVWAVSSDLIGAVAQAQRTVHSAQLNLRTRYEPHDDEGNRIGEAVYNFSPRSVVVIGSLTEFEVGDEVNESRFSSFEMFRRQLQSPEIITFDELYERARFIVDTQQDDHARRGAVPKKP